MKYLSLIVITFFLFWSSGCDSNGASGCGSSDKPIFSLEDLNPYSETYGEYIGPQTFNDKVTLYYFPFSETWGTCRNRFGSLDSLFIDYGGLNSNLAIIGVGKDNDTPVDGMIQYKILPYVKDDDVNRVWQTWCPEDRDLFFLDKNGFYNTKINLTSGFPENDIKEIIDTLL